MLAQFVVLVVGGTAPAWAFGAEQANSINLGVGGLNPLPHCHARVYLAEYERELTPTITFVGRGAKVHYRFDDGQYLEEGQMRGADVGARYYPGGAMRGFFMGATLGYWKQDRTFTHNQYTPAEWQGKASPRALRLNIDIGDRIPIGNSNVYIMPEVNFGKFTASSACQVTAPASAAGTWCNQIPEVSYYLFAEVLVGVAF